MMIHSSQLLGLMSRLSGQPIRWVHFRIPPSRVPPMEIIGAFGFSLLTFPSDIYPDSRCATDILSTPSTRSPFQAGDLLRR